MRCPLILVGLALLAPAAADAKNVSIKWHGQSFFEVSSSAGTVIAIDPHFLEGYGRRDVQCDAVLISHFHIDHASPDNIVDYGKTKKLFGLKNPDGLRGNRKNDEFNEFEEKVRDVSVRCVGAYHDKVQGMQRGKNSIFILEVDGLRIVHLGDLAHTLSEAQVKKIGKVHILMVPVGGVYALNGSDAKKVVEQLQPSHFVLPMHYGTKVYDYLLSEEEFLEEQDEKYVSRPKTNELIVDSEAAPRKKPAIVVLSYEQPQK